MSRYMSPTWYKDAVFYQIYVRAYKDGNGDGHGDFKGLLTKLDYLQQLGVDCVWIMPMYPSPLVDDGYDVADYRGIHEDYGTLEEFQAYAAPHFAAGRGWSYLSTVRNIGVSEAGDTAWFDERLLHERHGECRGTGVLRRTPEGWKIVRYNLTIPIPNGLLPEVAQRIREADRTPISEWR